MEPGASGPLGAVLRVGDNQRMRSWVLAALFLTAAPVCAGAEPRLTLSKYQIYAGEVITLRASGYAPNTKLVSHLFRPDGTEYPVMTFETDARGELSHRITIVPIDFGTYEIRVLEEVSRAAASTRFVMVAPGWPAPAETSPTTAVPATVTGVWEGDVQAKNTAGSPALLSIANGLVGTVVGTVAYPARLCGGELWLVGVEGRAVHLGEVITYGIERCNGDGIVTLTAPENGDVTFSWRDAGRQHAVVEATATLTPRSQ